MSIKSGTFSPPGEDIIQDFNRKIAVLKKATIKEREEKQKEVEEIENLKKKLSILEMTLSEKESQIEIINTDKEKAEKELYKLRDQIRQSGNTGSFQGARKSVANLEQQNKKLLDEYYFLKQQNVDLKNMIAALTQEHTQIQKDIKAKDSILNKIKKDNSKMLDEAVSQKLVLENELKESKVTEGEVSEKQLKLIKDLEDAYSNQKEIEEEWNVLNQKLLMKQGAIAGLNERLLKLSENEASLSRKLMEYKDELAQAESYYQKHEIMKIAQMNNYPATIILKHDHLGSFVMEIEERKNKNTYEIQNIAEIALNQDNNKRFFIRFIDSQVLMFESNDSETQVSKMNNFLKSILDKSNSQ